MALHPDFPDSPHEILDPAVRWFPADEALRDTTMDKLMPPLVAQLRRKVKDFRDSGYPLLDVPSDFAVTDHRLLSKHALQLLDFTHTALFRSSVTFGNVEACSAFTN
ncbi:MAG: hypothetical protein O3A00_14035 [Planctomycetota bacterium]|nr:hypothetical protein [Planctomycetota bacterium]